MWGKTIYLVDGENILLRYQSMLKSGSSPRDGVIYKQDEYVWHPEISEQFFVDILRISYYTTKVGDQGAIENLCNEIAEISFNYEIDNNKPGSGTLNPFVFKKERRSAKTKSVDINLTIDALRHAYNKDIGRLVICSGDGDYIPLIKEVMRHGVMVMVMAMSEGCHPSLKHIPDDFYLLDEILFESNSGEDTSAESA